MIRILALLVLVLATLGPAQAHKLKVFATVEGASVKGYAFFVGGGRAQDTPWIAKDATGASFAEGKTDDDGRFVFDVPAHISSDVTVTVDTHEGHIASATLPIDRFDHASPPPDASPPVPDAASAAPATPATPATGASGSTQTVSAEKPPSQAASITSAQIAALVDVAVQRQIAPLMEQIEQMDSRLRFTDVLSGLFLILGLAGMGLWVYGRRA